MEKRFSLPLEETKQSVREKALEKEGKIVKEQETKLIIEHGDWNTEFNFVPQDKKTKVVTETKLKTSHAALFGIVFVGLFFVSIFIWGGVFTLQAQISELRSTPSGWLAELFGYSGFQETQLIVDMLQLIGYFLIIMGVILAITLIYIYNKKENFPEKVLILLPQ